MAEVEAEDVEMQRRMLSGAASRSNTPATPYTEDNPEAPTGGGAAEPTEAPRWINRYRFLHKCYMTYFFLTAAICVFLFGLNSLLGTIYFVLVPAVADEDPTFSTVITTFSFLMLESYFWASFLSANVTTVKDMWRRNHEHSLRYMENFIYLANGAAGRCGCNLRMGTSDAEWGLILLESLGAFVIPALIGLILALAKGAYEGFTNYMLLAAYGALILVTLRWLAIYAEGIHDKVLAWRELPNTKWQDMLTYEPFLAAWGAEPRTVRLTATTLGLILFCGMFFMGVAMGYWGTFASLFLILIAMIALVVLNLPQDLERFGLPAQKKRLAASGTLIVCYLLWFLIGFISSAITGGAQAGFFILFLLLTQGLLTRKGRRESRPTGQSNALLFSFVMVYALLSSVLVLFGRDISKADVPKPTETKAARAGQPIGTSSPYPICNFRWIEGKYTIIDFAFLSALSYSSGDALEKDVEEWFGDSFELRVPPKAANDSGVVFYDFYDRKANASIVAIRGTSNGLDVLQDARIWGDAQVFQLASAVGPFVSIWPSHLTTAFIATSSAIQNALSPQGGEVRYTQDVEDYIKKIMPQRRDVMLTGHSLGGGLSKLVGAMLRARTVTFSAPGVMWSKVKYDVTTDLVNQYAFSVIPGTDIVPKVDSTGGLVQYIHCDYTYVQCHFLKNTVCELLNRCGDPKSDFSGFGDRTLKGCTLDQLA